MSNLPEDGEWRPRPNDRWIEPVFGALQPVEEPRIRRRLRAWLIAVLVATLLAWWLT